MKRILVLAHRTELIIQAVGHAANVNLRAAIEMGSLRAGKEEVIVSSVQTQIAFSKCRSCRGEGCDMCGGRGKTRRMERFNPFDFGLLIIDEAHHATATSYRLIIEWYKQNPELKILMVTATPKRADGIGMHNVCESVAYEMGLRAGIDEGWLVPVRQRFVTVESLDLSQVDTVKGDLVESQLERAFLGETDIEEERNLHAIIKPCLDEAAGRPLLIFGSGAEHVKKLAAAANAYPGVVAEYVLGETDKHERPKIIERYKRGDTQVLVNFGCLTEGFDAPQTAVIGGARPTKSESLYLQILGRGTRTLPGVVDGLQTADERRQAIAESAKPFVTVLDFVGNSGRHKLVSVADVLAGDSVEPVDLEAALNAAKASQQAVDMDELIEKAKQAREAREQREAEERQRRMTRHKAENVQSTQQDVDLFGGRSFDPFNDYEPAPWGATQKQVALLVKLGVSPEQAVKYSKGQAGAVIDKLKSQTGPDYIVTFGKYAGRKLGEVPKGYLQWCCDSRVGGSEFQRNASAVLSGQTVSSLEETPF